MLRWLTGLAFALFLAAVIGLVNVAFAALEEPQVEQAAVRWQSTAYPSTATATNPPSYPLQAVTLTITATPSSTVPATPTVGGGGATATPSTATPSFTRTITPSPTITLTPPLATNTVLVITIATATVTPIRVIGLPVPGPSDKLPSTGGSMLSLLNALLLSGGAGGALFVVGRVLRRRQP